MGTYLSQCDGTPKAMVSRFRVCSGRGGKVFDRFEMPLLRLPIDLT